MNHRWDEIRVRPTVIRGIHESILRAYQILNEVRRMLAAGDSTETIASFIEWAEL